MLDCSYRYDLQAHMNKEHLKNASMKCGVAGCKAVFVNLKDKNRHMKRTQGDQLGVSWTLGGVCNITGVRIYSDGFRVRASKSLQISVIFHVNWGAKLRLSCRHEFYCLEPTIHIFPIMYESFMKFHRVLFEINWIDIKSSYLFSTYAIIMHPC